MDDFSFRFGEGESLKGVWRVIRKRKATIAMASLCGLGLASLACVFMGTQYAGTATIEVQKTDASQISLLNNFSSLADPRDDIKTDVTTHLTVLQSPNVLLAVVRDLNLQAEAPFKFKPTIMGALNGSNAAHRR